ncbi:MAG: N-acetyltransferase [Myxococcales bacterium]|nr:N-acetyltransferase [Myxococcales bacterium]
MQVSTHPGAPAARPPLEVSVEPVRTPKDRDEFLKLQLRLYRGDPNFVPPILAERRDFLDPAKNPFLGHAELALFLARRGGRVAGRIAAINDSHYNQFHNTECGFFGMFESEDDPAVACALVDAAAEWVRRGGMKQLIGPVNLSFNHDCGVLVEGFEHPPAMMMPYNPPTFDALLKGAGLEKCKDLWAWELSTSVAPPDKVVRVAEKVREQEGVRVRPIDMRALPQEIRRIKSIYNAMLERSWGFVPLSDEEFDAFAVRLRPLVQIRPELCLIAEVLGEPAAFSLTLPDSNVAIRAANGRLTTFGLPVGLLRLLWAARGIDRVRVLLLGIKPGFRRRGLDALLYLDTMHAARKLGFTGGELGWTAEDNDLINRAVESMGARRYKTYRIYEKQLG